MAVQSRYGRIGSGFEDFTGIAATFSIADATAGTRFNNYCLVAVSGQSEVDFTVDESNGVISLNGAGGAADGIAIIGSPMRPDRNAPMTIEARFKNSSATDYRAFLGWQQTASLSETVNPWTLSGTTLTSNAAGEVVGFYTDAAATTDDFRFMAGSNSAASTSARCIVGSSVSSLNSGATTLGSLGIRTGTTLTADKYSIGRVVLNPDGSAEGYFGDETMAGSPKGPVHIATVLAGDLATNVLYFPVLLLVATSTGDPIAEVDYIDSYGNRWWGA